MILAREFGRRDALQEQGDDLGRKSQGQGIRDGQPSLTQASEGCEKGMEFGRDASCGDKEDLTPARGIDNRLARAEVR
ncbi:hypothetical protein KSX_96490 [Ktedonospora formicarum]|uniref:Uncharacterized protein n=1 Tax=Ktedonospora formicarum TaxID=2778364 RepID=A0A8J3MZU8_9CHLR|nr:hypothetical protein KSX_93180 [Ktedonospora formicarum]GHO51486.1 hypothetical protein KSX_96490 [Ktedonospora formicarum]